MPQRSAVVLLAAAFCVACSDDAMSNSDAFFPEDYASTYVEVRGCRPNGGSHDFNQIRVLADPAAASAYKNRDAPFPTGAIVLKEEYDSADTDCSGYVVQWSVMLRRPAGDDTLLGWQWQRVDGSGSVLGEDEARCSGCHQGCGPPDGYEGTCTVP